MKRVIGMRYIEQRGYRRETRSGDKHKQIKTTDVPIYKCLYITVYTYIGYTLLSKCNKLNTQHNIT